MFVHHSKHGKIESSYRVIKELISLTMCLLLTVNMLCIEAIYVFLYIEISSRINVNLNGICFHKLLPCRIKILPGEFREKDLPYFSKVNFGQETDNERDFGLRDFELGMLKAMQARNKAIFERQLAKVNSFFATCST